MTALLMGIPDTWWAWATVALVLGIVLGGILMALIYGWIAIAKGVLMLMGREP